MTLLGGAGRALALAVLLWGAGFLWFSLALPGPAPLTHRTDAVVVLTGGEGRLKRGLEVLDAGSATLMLISGVGRRTTRRQLAEAAGLRVSRLDRAELGYAAVDTRSNAEETAAWMAHHRFRSLRLVTSAGHMRRARLELGRVLPAGVEVVSDAVPIEPRAPGIAWEYSKWLLRRAALLTGAA
ncbi:hypothetical protein IP88_14915 [alpha proteobacterium AAP81b]|nr:hypothetical protein IP88_14915 [alpha proteobacterium AAP81b]